MESTRDKLIHSALRLFADKGYASTSVADILGAAGLHSGSLYHFFPTKQDLLLAVLRTYHDGIVPMLLEPAWRRVGDPVERVFALLDRYRGLLEATHGSYGCPIGSLALELHEPDPPVRELLALNFAAWVGHVEACLVAARSRFKPGFDPHAAATFTLSVMEGAVMQARTFGNLRPFDASVRCLRDYFSAQRRTRRKR